MVRDIEACLPRLLAFLDTLAGHLRAAAMNDMLVVGGVKVPHMLFCLVSLPPVRLSGAALQKLLDSPTRRSCHEIPRNAMWHLVRSRSAFLYLSIP